MHYVITGGTGLIGRALVADLAKDGAKVFILSRNPEEARNLPAGVEAVRWDGKTSQGWGQLVNGAAAVINLAGASVAGSGFHDMRWTDARKEAIYQSRLHVGHAVVEAIEQAADKPAVLVQSSAVGYYGTMNGDAEVTEAFPPGSDFLAKVCVDWEDTTQAVDAMGVRRVIIRTGVVLSRDGGALPKQALPFRMFAGGPIGSGDQWYPWIHIDDEVAAIRFLIDNDAAAGVYNLAAPNPVSNEAFSTALGRAMYRPSFMRVPGVVFRVAFGEAATILLDGQRAVPHRLLEQGFAFKYPEPEAALRNLYGTEPGVNA